MCAWDIQYEMLVRGMCCVCGWCVSGFGFLGWRFAGSGAGANRRRAVGDSCWGYFLTNGLDLHKESANDDRLVSCGTCGVCLCETWRASCLPGNQFPVAEGGGDRAACGRQRWTLASASSCKSFHNPVPVIELQRRDDKIKTSNKIEQKRRDQP